MGATKQFRRIRNALLVSLVLTGILLAIDLSIDPKQQKLSRTLSIVDALQTPADAFVARLVPGHDFTQPLVAILFLVVFYAIAAWVLLSLWAWRRTRRYSQNGHQQRR